jgi:hypothetical protein
MNGVRPPPLLNRRQLLLLAGSSVTLGASRDEFWNTKPPSEWEVGEIYRLMNNSPWANTVEVRRPMRDGSTVKAAVTWESALPICDALRSASAPEFADHYVIGVDGVGTGGNGAEYLRYAVLRAAGHPKWVVWAASVREVIRSSPVYLFSFLRSAAPIGPKTGEVLFLLNLRPGTLGARFKPDQMRYHGQLAL